MVRSRRIGFSAARDLARPWLVFAVAAGAALAATVAVPLAAPLRFAYPAPSLHVALETGTALIGLLATAIVVRGWRDGPRLDRLIIAAGLAVIAVDQRGAGDHGRHPAGEAARAGSSGSPGCSSGRCSSAPAPSPRRAGSSGRRSPPARCSPVVVVALAAATVPVELVLDEWRGAAAAGGHRPHADAAEPAAAGRRRCR